MRQIIGRLLPFLFAVAFSGMGHSESSVEIAKELEGLNAKQQKLYRELALELRCPTCTGLSILQSDAPFSLAIRKAVLEQVRSNKTYPEIIDFFTARYGLWILRTPPSSGFHLIAWLVPILLAFFLLFSLWYYFWRRRSVVSSMGVRSADAILDEMASELDKLRGART